MDVVIVLVINNECSHCVSKQTNTYLELLQLAARVLLGDAGLVLDGRDGLLQRANVALRACELTLSVLEVRLESREHQRSLCCVMPHFVHL